MPYPEKEWESGEVIMADDMNDFERAMSTAVSAAEEALERIENLTATINSNMELVITI